MNMYSITEKDGVLYELSSWLKQNPLDLKELDNNIPIIPWNKGLPPEEWALKNLEKGRKPRNSEVRKKMSLAKLGSKNPMFGKKEFLSEIAKLSKRNYDKSKDKRLEKITCTHCNKTGSRMIMKRWHFDKCKSII